MSENYWVLYTCRGIYLFIDWFEKRIKFVTK